MRCIDSTTECDVLVRVHAIHVRRYAQRVPSVRILLLTGDAANRAAAAAMGLEALGLPAYAASRAADAPELQDLVARQEMQDEDDDASAKAGPGPGSTATTASAAAAAAAAGGSGARRSSKRKRVYEQHKAMSELAAGIAAGRLHQGAMRVSRCVSCLLVCRYLHEANRIL
jgi:exosome complex exonuclease DIS3/RRP44